MSMADIPYGESGSAALSGPASGFQRTSQASFAPWGTLTTPQQQIQIQRAASASTRGIRSADPTTVDTSFVQGDSSAFQMKNLQKVDACSSKASLNDVETIPGHRNFLYVSRQAGTTYDTGDIK